MVFKGLLICLFICINVRGICIGGQNRTCISQALRDLFFKTVCYPHLGCFTNGPPFYHPIYRPISIPPKSPDVIMPLYLLFTRRNRYRAIYLSEGDHVTLKKSTFNPRAITRIITHGYLDGVGITSFTTRLKDTLLMNADDNVIILDWSAGSALLYTTAVANSQVAGALLANFIRYLCAKTSTQPEMFHLIGHSLGAQAISYTGERIKNLGRITGLEPAGPFYSFLPPEARLDPSDALFVDNIHTNQGYVIIDGLGTPQDVGHLDFWPWNGQFPLAGCINRVISSALTNPLPEVNANLLSCKHRISIEMFIYSFNQSNCMFVGVKCRSWDEFTAGHCNCGNYGENCNFMGFYAQPPRHIGKQDDWRHYLLTALKEPYCIHQYQLKVYIDTFHLSAKIENMAQITVFGHDNELSSKIKLNIENRKTKQILTFLLTSEKALGQVQAATIWLGQNNWNNYEMVSYDWQHHNRTYYNVNKVEITYLYPAAKTYTSFLLCRRPIHQQKSFENKFLYSQQFCRFSS